MFDKLKSRAALLKREITALYYAYQNPALPVLPRFVIIFTLGYALSPIDLIPDFIPVLGYLDDLIILPSLIALSLKLIPQEIMAASRLKAEKEPLRLKNNWAFAAIFALVWIVLIVAVVSAAWSAFAEIRRT